MKSLVIYDSQYGNTAKVAEAIGRCIGECRVLQVAEADPSELNDLDLLLVGSPTQAGRPTQAVASFLSAIPSNSLVGVHVGAFDTRLSPANHGLPLRILFHLIGFAGARIAAKLQARGGSVLASPAGFIVEGKEGPLQAGELERAVDWARQLTASPNLQRSR